MNEEYFFYIGIGFDCYTNRQSSVAYPIYRHTLFLHKIILMKLCICWYQFFNSRSSLQCQLLFDSLQDLVDHVNDFHVKPERDSGYCCHWEGCARKGRGFNARWGATGYRIIHMLCKVSMARHQNLCFQVQNVNPHSYTHQWEAASLPYLQQELFTSGKPQDPQSLSHRWLILHRNAQLFYFFLSHQSSHSVILFSRWEAIHLPLWRL